MIWPHGALSQASLVFTIGVAIAARSGLFTAGPRCVVFTVLTDRGEHRLPFGVIVALTVIVVISNGWLVLLRDGEPVGRS